MYISSFVLLLGPLIFIHELGHYLFAKLFNVRVDAFSMGFGPKIFKKKKGETEYCLSVIPLGGYVKLLGQDPNEKIEPELITRTLNHQEPWKRFLIFIGGPLFNFLFAIVVIGMMLMIGESHVTTLVERVPSETQAAVAGFKSGDVITAIGHETVTKLEDVSKIISESINKELNFRVKRKVLNAEKIIELKATPKPTQGFSIYGEPMEVGAIDGLMNPARHSVIGVSDPSSIAARVGLKTGDEIVTINGKNIKNFEELLTTIEELNDSRVKEMTLGIVSHTIQYWQADHKPQISTKPTSEIKLPVQSLDSLGLFSSELFIFATTKGSPSETIGLQPGDRLISIENKTLTSFNQLRENVQTFGETKGKFNIVFERLGKKSKVEMIPSITETKDVLGRDVKQYLIGIYPLFVASDAEIFVERTFNPFTLTSESWSRAIDLSVKTIISLKKLATRQVSVQTLGGPLLIGKLAGDSMERGISQFLKVMALISISLAIFNILPVPILDGGHIFILMIEVVRGRPISLRQSELAQQVGLSLILLLLVVVMFNDISRVGLPAIKRLLE